MTTPNEPPKEAEVTQPEPERVEFAPPGQVEWKAGQDRPEEWRPAESPAAAPKPAGQEDEWHAPERAPLKSTGDEKVRE